MSNDPSQPKPEAPPSPDASANGAAPAPAQTPAPPAERGVPLRGEPTATSGYGETSGDGESSGVERTRPGLVAGIGADWAAVIVAAVLVLLAVSGVLPAIPFLVR